MSTSRCECFTAREHDLRARAPSRGRAVLAGSFRFHPGSPSSSSGCARALDFVSPPSNKNTTHVCVVAPCSTGTGHGTGMGQQHTHVCVKRVNKKPLYECNKDELEGDPGWKRKLLASSARPRAGARARRSRARAMNEAFVQRGVDV